MQPLTRKRPLPSKADVQRWSGSRWNPESVDRERPSPPRRGVDPPPATVGRGRLSSQCVLTTVLDT